MNATIGRHLIKHFIRTKSLAMEEILAPSLLSLSNGLLEGTKKRSGTVGSTWLSW
jgi:hypothetical protein